MVISALAVYVPLARMMISPGAALLMAVCNADKEDTFTVAANRAAGTDSINSNKQFFFMRQVGLIANVMK
jgi:hypothetical protein